MTSLKQQIEDGPACESALQDMIKMTTCNGEPPWTRAEMSTFEWGWEAGALWAFRLVLEMWNRYRYLSQASQTVAEMLAFKSESATLPRELDAWAKEILDGDYK